MVARCLNLAEHVRIFAVATGLINACPACLAVVGFWSTHAVASHTDFFKYNPMCQAFGTKCLAKYESVNGFSNFGPGNPSHDTLVTLLSHFVALWVLLMTHRLKEKKKRRKK